MICLSQESFGWYVCQKQKPFEPSSDWREFTRRLSGHLAKKKKNAEGIVWHLGTLECGGMDEAYTSIKSSSLLFLCLLASLLPHTHIIHTHKHTGFLLSQYLMETGFSSQVHLTSSSSTRTQLNPTKPLFLKALISEFHILRGELTIWQVWDVCPSSVSTDWAVGRVIGSAEAVGAASLRRGLGRPDK